MGEFVLERGRGTPRALAGVLRVFARGIGDAVFERGSGMWAGDGAWDGGDWRLERMLWGVGWDDRDEVGDGDSVRVKEGVRVFRDNGLRIDTFRSLSIGDGYRGLVSEIVAGLLSWGLPEVLTSS